MPATLVAGILLAIYVAEACQGGVVITMDAIFTIYNGCFLVFLCDKQRDGTLDMNFRGRPEIAGIHVLNGTG